MASTPWVFPYRPLSTSDLEARLVRILPGSFDDNIRCTIWHAPLDSQKYEALSYCWGDARVRKPIQLAYDDREQKYDEKGFSLMLRRKRRAEAASPCNQDGFTDIQVTANLEAALRHLRYERSSRVLWIDAICLNQQDVQEKSIQLPNMGLIYRKAATVVVWLGMLLEPEDEARQPGVTAAEVQASFEYLVRTGRKAVHDPLDFILVPWEYLERTGKEAFRHPLDLFRIEKLRGAVDDTRVVPDSRFVPPDHLEAGLNVLRTRQWFWRVWTLQEHVLGGRNTMVICGACKAYLRDLTTGSFITNTAIQYMRAENGVSEKAAASLAAMSQNSILREIEQEVASWDQTSDPAGPAMQLLWLLLNTSRLQATNPRDKVYGMLGLVKDWQSVIPPADYTMPLSEFYLQVACNLIEKTGNLALLQVPYKSPVPTDPKYPSQVPMPSWVPTWQDGGGRPSMKFLQEVSRLQGKSWRSSDRQMLFTDAVDLGEIIHLGHIPGKISAPEFRRHFLNAVDVLNQVSEVRQRHASSTYSTVDELAYSILPRLWSENHKEWWRGSFQGAMFEIYMGQVEWPGRLKSPGPNEQADVKRYEALLAQDYFVQAGTTYFALSTGRVAAYTAEKSPQLGDSIMVLKGAKDPKVLRPENIRNQATPEYKILDGCQFFPLVMCEDPVYMNFWRENGLEKKTIALV